MLRVKHDLLIQKQRKYKHLYARSKVGKQSIKIWYEAYVESQERARTIEWDTVRLEGAFESVAVALKKATSGCLRPLPIERCPAQFISLSKSAGKNRSGAKSKAELDWEEVTDLHQDMREGDSSTILPYSLAFRSHIHKVNEPPKGRVIMVAPGAFAIVEKRFATPMQKAMTMDFGLKPWATGWDWRRLGGQQLFDRFPVEETLSLDFSSFDNSTPTWFTDRVFDLIADCFELGDSDWNVLDCIRRNHTQATAVWGTRRFKMTGGIRTGSAFTHVIGTITCAVLTKYLCPDEDSLSFGDDCLIRTRTTPKQANIFFRTYSSFRTSPTKSRRGVDWLGLRRQGDSWVLPDPAKRWGQLFHPERLTVRASFLSRMQACLLSCGNDPMRWEIRRILTETGSLDLAPDLHLSLPQWGNMTPVVSQNILDLDDYVKFYFV